MIGFKLSGNLSKTEKLLKKSLGRDYMIVLGKYALQGLEALSAATPVDTGLTAVSWSSKIVQDDTGISIVWENDNVNNYVSIALVLQYGHATRNGGYIAGRDYINPAIRPIFDKMAEAIRTEVTKL